MSEVQQDDLITCAKCNEIIKPGTKSIALDDAENYHIECAAKILNYHCTKCGYMYCEKPEDMMCDSPDGCGSKVVYVRSWKKVDNIIKEWAFNRYAKTDFRSAMRVSKIL